jgi:hypothetical protein
MDGDHASRFVSFLGTLLTKRSRNTGCFVRAFFGHVLFGHGLAHLCCGTSCCGGDARTGNGGKVQPSRTVTRRFSVRFQHAANLARVNLPASRAQPSTSLPGEQFPPGWVRELRQGSAFWRPVCGVWQSRLALQRSWWSSMSPSRCLPINYRHPFMIRRRGWNCQPVS